ncbi:MAG: site-specific integrase [Euryarchaeota archaeon]|nr:site-specific integrase [Euryarchaeota archaeon]
METLNGDLADSPFGGGQASALPGASDEMKYAWTPTGSGLRAELNRLWANVTNERRIEEMNWTLFYGFLREHDGLQPGTTGERFRHLKRMAGLSSHPRGTHVDSRVKLTGSVDEVIESFCDFINARKEAGASSAAIKNDYVAFGSYLKMLRIPAKSVLPRQPHVLGKPKEMLPSPESIHALLHDDFGIRDAKRSYELSLARHLLFFDFAFGVRFPSEAWSLRLNDYDPENHLLTVREPKKGGRLRQIVIEPRYLCCAPNRLSLANYVTHWRPKVDPDWTQEAFFLQADGTPFTSKSTLAGFLRKLVAPKYPWYHGYLGRTWNINARLIETAIERDNGRFEYDWVSVANWVGHENLSTMRRYYDQFVDVQRTIHGAEWLTRAFVTPRKIETRTDAPRAAGVRAFVEARRRRNASLTPRKLGGVARSTPSTLDGSVRI